MLLEHLECPIKSRDWRQTQYIGLWLVVLVWVWSGRIRGVESLPGVSALRSNLGNWLQVLTFHNFSLVLKNILIDKIVVKNILIDKIEIAELGPFLSYHTSLCP